jgi:hypothetical protein
MAIFSGRLNFALVPIPVPEAPVGFTLDVSPAMNVVVYTPPDHVIFLILFPLSLNTAKLRSGEIAIPLTLVIRASLPDPS